MQVIKDFTYAHPALREANSKIQEHIISKYNAPFRLFETSRDHARHQILLSKGRTKDIISRHLYNVDNDPPLYCTAMDYVYFTGQWSWNLRNSIIFNWYVLFGNLVLDVCPELWWEGLNRKSTNYNHFELRREVIIDNIDEYPCVVP